MRALIPALLCAVCVGQTPADVANAELAFAKLSSEKGISAAFLANLAEGSHILSPVPVDARAHYAADKDPGLLSWRPAWVGVASSGDLAYSTGPWEYRVKADQPPLVQGHFLSIWAKQADGSWKVVFDCGVPHGAVADPPGWQAYMPKTWGHPPSDTKVQLLDQTLFDGASRLQRLAFGAVLYRSRREPLQDRGDILAELRGEPGKAYLPQGSGVSSAGDLAYTWGVASSTPIPMSYCHVWVRPSGVWQLLYDLELPLPSGPAAKP